MIVHFSEPPASQRIGGLEAAIRAIEASLNARGCRVTSGTATQAQPGDVVHFHGLWQPEQARISASLAARGIPFVISPHGMLEPWAWRHKWWKKWPYYWLIERRHLRRASVLLATAPTEARRLQGMLPAQRVETLPLGLTDQSAVPDYAGARQALGWGQNEVVLLFLSRLHEKKGLELLIRALAILKLPGQLRLVVVGGGEPNYVESLHHLAKSVLPEGPRVDWVGEVWGDRRWPYFQGADLFCLPSYSENFGLAVLEACQVGTPCLTTNTTPWGEWLNSGLGFIVDPRIDKVAGGLRSFFAQLPIAPERRTQLAAWTRETFAWETLAPRYEALYRNLGLGK